MRRSGLAFVLAAGMVLAAALPAGAVGEESEPAPSEEEAVPEPLSIDPSEFEMLAPTEPGNWDNFGTAVAYDGNRIVIGAPFDAPSGKGRDGSAWVFTLHGLGWHAERLLPSQRFWHGGSTQRRYGIDVDIADDRIVIGAQDAWVGAVVTGGVFVYDYIDGEWVETIMESDGIEDHDCLGYSVEISEDGTRIAAGTWRNTSGGHHRAGKVIVWDLVDGEWIDTVLEPSDGEQFDIFGAGLGLGDGFVAIGAPYHDAAGKDAGAVYVYEEAGGEWVETQFHAEEPVYEGLFGIYLEVRGDEISVWADEFDGVEVITRSADGWDQRIVSFADEEESDGDDGDPVVQGGELTETGTWLFRTEWGEQSPWHSPGTLIILERTVDDWVEIGRVEGTDLGEGAGFGAEVLVVDDDTWIVSAPWWIVDGRNSGAVFVRGFGPVCGDWEPTILGTHGDDRIVGTPGDDVILPGDGDDVIVPSGGRDVYCLEEGTYRFTGPVPGERLGPEGMVTLIADPLDEQHMLVAD